MADVTGTIGNEYVELNNAATEATLRLLLQATIATTKAQKDAIKDLATKSGLDPKAVDAANAGLTQAGTAAKQGAASTNLLAAAGKATVETFRDLDQGLSPLIKNLSEGTATVGNVFETFSKLGGPIGAVFEGFRRIAEFQEQNLKMYQTISNAGVNFGGSLTQMRQAALNTYMTLDQFTNLMKTNGETFARLGGTAEEGAQSFIKLSNSLLSSDAGSSLRALGYTTEQVNAGFTSYLAITGARTRSDIQNTAALTKGAADYLTQLDALATITGKSREEQEKALKQASQNAAYEQMMLGMDEKQKKAYAAGLAEMSAKFGKAGEDLFKSQAMGLPPMTEAAQKLQALSPEVANASQKMSDIGRSGGELAETQRASAQATAGAVEASKRFSNVAGALSFSTDGTSAAMMGLTRESTRARAQGAETTEAGIKQQAEIAAAQKERTMSEASEAAKAQQAVQEMGQAIMKLLMPALQLLTPIVNALAGMLNGVVQVFSKLDTGLQLIIAGLAAYLLVVKKLTATQALSGVSGNDSDLGGGKGKGLGKIAKGVGLGVVGSVAGDYAADYFGRDTAAGKTSDILGTAAGWAGMGAVLGPMGALAGGLAGAGYGAYKNFFANDKQQQEQSTPKMANGGIVTSRKDVTVAENEPEAILPLRHLETLRTELQTLNKQNAEILRYIRETADNTKNTVDATKALSGDLFRF